MSALRFLSRLAIVAAIVLLGAVVAPSGASAHAGHGGAALAHSTAEAALDDHHAFAGTDAAVARALDEPGARSSKGCAGACCSIACSMSCTGLALGPCSAPSPLADAAAIDLDTGHAQAPPDAPERHQPKPPRA